MQTLFCVLQITLLQASSLCPIHISWPSGAPLPTTTSWRSFCFYPLVYTSDPEVQTYTAKCASKRDNLKALHIWKHVFSLKEGMGRTGPSTLQVKCLLLFCFRESAFQGISKSGIQILVEETRRDGRHKSATHCPY